MTPGMPGAPPKRRVTRKLPRGADEHHAQVIEHPWMSGQKGLKLSRSESASATGLQRTCPSKVFSPLAK